MNVTDLSSVSVKELHAILQPDTLLERFNARRENRIGNTKDFLEIKGTSGQVENDY